jgi:XTP/dITP diphosphohydrolase
MRLVLSSRNPHKLRELRAALAGWELEALDVDESPEETGESYEENARLKARFGRSRAPADAWVIGEDAGVEVDALGGRPGVHSARWADRPVDALLAELGDAKDRGARFLCTIVAIAPDGREVVVEGRLDGTVARERRGTEGFGYDPVFVPTGEEQTVAELGNVWKSEHSARARAAQALRSELDPSSPQPRTR